MDPRGRRQRYALTGCRQIPPSGCQGADRLRDRSRGLREDLHLGSRKLALEPGVAAKSFQYRGSDWREVEGLGVEQHHLLLEADRQRLRGVEDRLEPRGVEVGLRGHDSETMR